MSTHTNESPPPSLSQPVQEITVQTSASDGLPSPATSHSDESGPIVGEMASLSDTPSSDWTGSDEESEESDHDFDMVASIDLSEAGSLGHRSTASSSGSGTGINKMKLSYPNPMTTNQEVEPDSMDDYQPDSAYSFLHDASPAVEPPPTEAGSVVTDGTSSTSDKVSDSVLDVRKAETSRWVETAAGNSPKKERRRSTVTSLPSKDDSPEPTTPPVLFQDVNASGVVPGAFSISQHTEPDSAASSFASIRSSDSNATVVTAKSSPTKPLYSQVLAENLPDESIAPSKVADDPVKPEVEVETTPLPDEKSQNRPSETTKATRGPSNLVTRSLIVLATILAISTVKLVETIPSFAELKSHPHSTALSTSLAVAHPSVSPAFVSAPSDSVPSSSGWVGSSAAQPAPPSALAVVPAQDSLAVDQTRPVEDEDDWVEDGDVDDIDALELLSMEEAQEREAFEIDEARDGDEEAEDETDHADDESESDDEPDQDFFNTILGGIGAPEFIEHVNGLLESVENRLSPYYDSLTEGWRDSIGQVPAKLSYAKHAHRQLRHRGRKAIGRRVRLFEKQGTRFAAAWLGAPARRAQAAWSQTTNKAKAAAHDAESALTGSKQVAAHAWAKAVEDEPEWTKRKPDEDWSLLGQGSVWKGLARRGVQGERLVRSPNKLGGLLGKSYKRAKEIKNEVDTFRRKEAHKHARAVGDKFSRLRKAIVDGQGPAVHEAEA